MKKAFSKIINISLMSIVLSTLLSCQQDDDSLASQGIEIQKNAITTDLTQNEALKAILAANPNLKTVGWDINTNPKEWPGVTSINDVVRELIIQDGLTVLPSEIRGLQFLKKLTINNTEITTIPVEIEALSELEELNLGNNNLQEIPEEIGSLRRLKKLLVYNNKLVTIPQTIGNLTQLRGLSIRGNQFYKLPESIKQLTNLRWINLENNEFHIIPITLDDLPKLQPQNVLSKGNPLTAVHREDVKVLLTILSAYPDLKKLTIGNSSGGTLSYGWQLDIDPSLWTGLKYNNQNRVRNIIFGSIMFDLGIVITSLPPELENLRALEFLQIERHNLKEFPIVITKLKNLKILAITETNLTSIPSQIGQLTKLQYLFLFNNQFRTVPFEISKLTNLETLWLGGNPIKSIPQEICDLNIPNFYIEPNVTCQ